VKHARVLEEGGLSGTYRDLVCMKTVAECSTYMDCDGGGIDWRAVN
jgi:hypothetical protein